MTPGVRLGSYEIVSVLGAGGMGEVYRARDTRLNRDVALKILSPRLARDPGALARFEREAHSVAKLSHPNIVGIHELSHHDGTMFVVTELVDGETLRERLMGGPLAVRRAVGYARQIAQGIAAAHARGIVHRDLKPENVMIARDDHVKILDFGLAKPLAPEPTDATHAATSPGTVLGTFAYMAPEQVRGLDVDHRADIFAVGAVLYEMLSGRRAFTGDTAADTMTAILTKDPPELDAERLAIPAALDRIVRRCLEKARELRFQSANDLAFALETLSAVSSSTAGKPPVVPPRAIPAWLPWTLAAAATTAAIAIWFLRASPATALWQRFTPITEASGEETAPALSPDGTNVAYRMRVNGRWGIYAQRVGGRNPTPIFVDPQRNVGGPAYSPDASSIAFHESDANGGIFVAGATGESVRRVTDIGFDPAWSPDGKLIAFTTEEAGEPSIRQGVSALFVVDSAGGAPKKIADGDAMQAAWSPSQRRIAYWSNTRGQRDLFTVAVDGGGRVAVSDDGAIDWSPVWSPDGRYLYYSSDRGGAMNLWRIAIDETSGRVIGAPEPVINGVQAGMSWPRFSKDGSRLAFQSRVKAVNPVAIPFDPISERAGVPRTLDRSNNIRVPSDVSPDGTELAYFGIGEQQEDAFVGPADGTMIRHLTDDPARDRGPMFTRDGKSIVFYSTRDGAWTAWMMRTDGSGVRKIAALATGCVNALASPIDDSIVCSGINDGVYLVRASGSGFAAPERMPNQRSSSGLFTATAFSPDGTKLAGVVLSDAGHPTAIAAYDLRAHALATFAADESFGVRWLPDNRRLIYFTTGGTELVVFDTVSRRRTPVAVPLPGASIDDMFALSPDGRTIYYGATHSEADIWIAEKK